MIEFRRPILRLVQDLFVLGAVTKQKFLAQRDRIQQAEMHRKQKDFSLIWK